MVLVGKKGNATAVIKFIFRIVIALLILYLAYVLFRYAYQKGDWQFISAPIKNISEGV